MATLNVIRRWALRDQLSIREISKRSGMARNTVKKYLQSDQLEPQYAKRVSSSKLDPYAEKLAGWLAAEVNKSRKQRLTLRQIHTTILSRVLIMIKNDFRQVFVQALNQAAEGVETTLGEPISRSFSIELHALGSSGRIVGVDEALDLIFLGDDRFYRIIDVAILKLLPGESVAFVRVSGHTPADFGSTWNPSLLGPFKQIVTEKIQDLRTGNASAQG